MPLRITQVMLARGFGGAERMFVDLCLALAQHGIEVQAIHNSAFVKRDILEQVPGVTAVPIPVRAGWDPFARARVRCAIDEFSPDAIHSHLARGAAFAGAAARRLRIPAAANLHNYVKLKYYSDIDVLVAGTDDQRHYLLRQGIDGNDICVIPHFSRIVPAERYSREAREKPVLVSLGRFVKKKGFDVLLQAMGRLVKSGLPVRLKLGGDGPERSNLEALANTLALSEHVTFGGWIDDVPSFLATGDFFVLPSRDEPFGIVMLEAMACGHTIITTRSKGPVEILDDNSAFFANPGSADSLAQAIHRAIDDPELSLRKAHAGLDLYRKNYQAINVIPQFVTMYENLRARRVVAYSR